MGDLKTVELKQIRENPVALRQVQRKSEEYLGLVNSIRQKGFMGAITVRAKTDKDTGQPYFELIDGLHRFSAAKDAGLEHINVDVVSLDDAAVLEAQLMTNIHKVETRPVEYSQQLRRILSRNPLMTEAELAEKLGKSSAWIQQRLGLTKITSKEIQTLVNEGKIPLSNAYALAKLPVEEMANFVDRAMTQDTKEFAPSVNKRVKELKENERKGLDPNADTFAPVAFMQKLKDVKTELESPSIGPVITAKNGDSTAEEGFRRAIQWFLHLDPDSVQAQREKDTQRKTEAEEAKKKKAAESTGKKAAEAAAKAKEAAEAAAKAQAELEASV